jgi:uncharacterized repeat protein (TIGR01451 family)
LVTVPSVAGPLTNSVVVSTGSTNSNFAANISTLVTAVVLPAPTLVAAGQLLIAESGPVNGAIDPGETVTVSLALANVGTANTTTNLIAVLQNSGGVSPVGGLQTNTYGALIHGGPAVAKSFSFTANGSIGDALTASLRLFDGATDLGAVTFSFGLPQRTFWASTNAVIIPDHGLGAPYPSIINIAGLTGVVSKAVVSLNGFSHAFPHDVSVLLVNPAGSSVLLMSHTGGGFALTNVTLAFDDNVPAVLPSSAPLVTGSTNRPTRYPGTVNFPAPAPAAPFGATLSGLNNVSPNGAWSLYVLDDTIGDAGIIAGGWSLDLTTIATVNPVADLAVTMASAPARLFVGGFVTNSISVANYGPVNASGVVLTHNLPAGVTFVDSVPHGLAAVSGSNLTCNLGALASGAVTNFLIVTAPLISGSFSYTASVAGNEIDTSIANNSASSSILSVGAPTLSGTFAPGRFELSFSTAPNAVFVVQASTNLTTWVPIATNTGAPISGSVVLTNDLTIPFRFYRAVGLTP